MEILNVQVPDALPLHTQIGNGDISFIHYQESTPVGRNLISFNQCAISFILSGQKDLYRLSESVVVNPHEAVIIPQGNAIIAERKLDSANYSSLVVFFPPQLAADFVRKHIASPIKHQPKPDKNTSAFLKFKVTAYGREYIHQLLSLIDKQIPLSGALVTHKLNELFLMLMDTCPAQFTALFGTDQATDTGHLKIIVENNLLKGLSLIELAFLSHRSLATFKRDFEKAYGTSPGKYIRERKLELATHALKQGRKVVDVSIELGYDNLSNFNTAFKRRFNQTASAYQDNHAI